MIHALPTHAQGAVKLEFGYYSVEYPIFISVIDTDGYEMEKLDTLLVFLHEFRLRPVARMLADAGLTYPSVLSLPRGQIKTNMSMSHIECVRLNIAITRMGSYNTTFSASHSQYPTHTQTKEFMATRND